MHSHVTGKHSKQHQYSICITKLATHVPVSPTRGAASLRHQGLVGTFRATWSIAVLPVHGFWSRGSWSVRRDGSPRFLRLMRTQHSRRRLSLRLPTTPPRGDVVSLVSRELLPSAQGTALRSLGSVRVDLVLLATRSQGTAGRSRTVRNKLSTQQIFLQPGRGFVVALVVLWFGWVCPIGHPYQFAPRSLLTDRKGCSRHQQRDFKHPLVTGRSSSLMGLTHLTCF